MGRALRSATDVGPVSRTCTRTASMGSCGEVRSDQHPPVRGLEGRIFRSRRPGRGLRKGTEAAVLARRMRDPALRHADFASRDAHASPAASTSIWRTAAPALRLCMGELAADLRPVSMPFLGRQSGKVGQRSLAEFNA